MRPVSTYSVLNCTRGVLLASEAELAQTIWARMKGLLGHSRMEFQAGKGLWIDPSEGIHTIGMTFPIDVLYLNRGRRVVRSYHALAPFRVGAISFKTRSVLELPAGTLARTRTAVGDVLEFRSNPRSGVTAIPGR